MSATIIVEDGTRIAGSNSYISSGDLSTYAANRGLTITGTSEDLIIKSMDFLEQLKFVGVKLYWDQSLQWPRANVWIDQYLQRFDVIPTLLKEAQCEICIAIDTDEDPLQNVSRQEKAVTVGAIHIEYVAGGSTITLMQRIYNKLRKLIDGNNGMTFDVRR